MRWFLAIVLCAVGYGCGSSGSETLSPAATGSPATATITFQSTLLSRKVAAYVTSMRFTGLDANNHTQFGPEDHPKAASITLINVPRAVTQLQVEYLPAPAGAGPDLQTLAVDLSSGTAVLQDPPSAPEASPAIVAAAGTVVEEYTRNGQLIDTPVNPADSRITGSNDTVALADVNGDGIADLIIGAGPGGLPQVTVIDGATGQQILNFLAFPATFQGGVFVAAGDLNGGGKADIVVGAGAGGGPQVSVFSGQDGTLLQQFLAFSPNFTGGVRVAVADLNGGGIPEVIAGSGPGMPSQISVYNGQTDVLMGSFMPINPNFQGGVYVAAGDLNGDGRGEIVVGPDAGGAPQVSVFDGSQLTLVDSFFAYDPAFTGGVRVAVGDFGNGRVEIVTGPGPGGPPQVQAFDPLSHYVLDSFFAAPTNFTGGVFVAAH